MTKPFEPTQEQVINRWHVQASGYDRLIDTWPHFRKMGDRLIQMLPPDFKGHLFDIGGGSGLIAEGVLRRFPHAQITLIEPAEEMCALAKKRLPDKVAVFVGTTEEFPPMESKADAAIANVAFHLMDESTALPALAAMLNPGSVFLANLWGHSFEETAHLDQRREWKSVLNRVLDSRGLPALQEHRVAPPRRRRRETLDQVASGCGFHLAEVSIQMRDESVHASIDFAAMHPAFLGDLSKEIREDVLRQTKAECDELEKISWAELRFERS